MISIIAAIDKNRALGYQNKLLVHLSEDLKHFKEITTGHVVIMGRKTYQAIGQALPNRINIVLSKDPKFTAENCEIFNDLDKALEFAKAQETEEIFFIGGGQIYQQALPLADKLYLTIIDAEYQADTWFPDYSIFDKVIKEEMHETDNLKYKFVELIKNED
jgi:dihydrofolate reductase